MTKPSEPTNETTTTDTAPIGAVPHTNDRGAVPDPQYIPPQFTDAEAVNFKKIKETQLPVEEEISKLRERAAKIEQELPKIKEGVKREKAAFDMNADRNRALVLQEKWDKLEARAQVIIDRATERARKTQAKKALQGAPLPVEGSQLVEVDEGVTSVSIAGDDDPNFDDFTFRKLTEEEKAERDEIERNARILLDGARKSAVEAAKLIQSIRQKRLYVDFVGGWYEYCQTVWNMSPAQARRQMVVAQIADQIVALKALPPRPGGVTIEGLDISDLKESAFRELNQVPSVGQQEKAETMAQVLAVARHFADTHDEKVTAKLIRAVIDNIKATGKVAVPDSYGHDPSAGAAPEQRTALLQFQSGIQWVRFRGKLFMVMARRVLEEGRGYVTRYTASVSDGMELEALMNAPIWKEEVFPTMAATTAFLEGEAESLEDMWEDDKEEVIARLEDIPLAQDEGVDEDTSKVRWYVVQDIEEETWLIHEFEEGSAFDDYKDDYKDWSGPYYDKAEARQHFRDRTGK